MPQFLIAPEDVQGERFVLRGPEAFHVAKVLRRKVGQSLEIFDGKGGRYAAVIESLPEDGTVEGRITGILHSSAKGTKISLELYLGLLKSSRWDWALEKAAEIGVSAIIPVLTPRTVVQLREEAGPKKAERWRKVLIAAAKQCGRPEIPELREPVQYREAIVSAAKEGPTFMGWAKTSGADTSLHEAVLEARKKQAESMKINLFIGPEGGFSEDEAELAELEGAHLFHLGSTTLRGETAAIVASSLLLHEFGSL
ncbi:MAG: RsmE family RNA methyltransferase [Elusimicrobiota bacterium]|jgi:16S rRNA (uracil1498-N3)-methyltransferase